MGEAHRESGTTTYCVQRIGRGDYQVPGICPDCGEQLFLVLPHGWRDSAGRRHIHAVHVKVDR